MNNIVFVIWVIGWPLSQTISAYVYEHCIGREYSANERATGALIQLAIWIFIAIKLYESN